MKRVDVVSALIYDEHGNVLIVKNRKGDSFYWSLPAGAVKAGETMEQALIREVKEETGYSVAIEGLHSVREMFFAEAGHHALILTFHARIVGGELSVDNDPDQDIAEAEWVASDRLKERMPALSERLRINDDKSKSPAFYAFEGVR